MYRSLLLGGVVVLLLSACVSSGRGDGFPPVDVLEGETIGAEVATDEPGLADIELCDASDYRGLIGANIAATNLPAGPRLRAFSEDDIITQEYIPQRTNIVYDAKGTILRVYCG